MKRFQLHDAKHLAMALHRNALKPFRALKKRPLLWLIGTLAVITTPVVTAVALGGTESSNSASGGQPEFSVKLSTDKSSSFAPARSSSSENSSSNNTSNNVVVNRQSIAVPENGEIHKVLPSDNGQTIVDISSQHHSSPSGESNSSATSVQISSESNDSSSSSNIHVNLTER